MIIAWMLMFISVYMLFRNQWVYNQRIYLINTNFDLYLKLPTYDCMMFKFWVWNVDKFLPKKTEVKQQQN